MEGSSHHKGPHYGFIPNGTYMDSASQTWENARGSPLKVTWTDGFDNNHAVNFSGNSGSCTVVFPIPYGGNWMWQDSDGRPKGHWERTGFTAAVTWVQVQFHVEGGGMFSDPYIGFSAAGHIKKGEQPDSGLRGEIMARLKDGADAMEQIDKIVSSGCHSAEQAVSLYASIQGLPASKVMK